MRLLLFYQPMFEKLDIEKIILSITSELRSIDYIASLTFNDTDNDKFRTLYAELKSTIDAGVSISAGTGNDSIWRRIYDKVFGLDSSICARWKELVPDFSWYDPNFTYYDDVIAFSNAVKDYVIENNIISKTDI